MFKTEEFFSNMINDITENYGYKLLGTFTAGSDRFKYHVGSNWYDEVRATTLVFTMPNKAIVAVFTYYEHVWAISAVEAGANRYRDYWSAYFEFNFQESETKRFSEFLIENHHESYGVEYFTSDFPVPDGWNRNWSSQGSNNVTYTMEAPYINHEGGNALKSLLELLHTRELASHVCEGKLSYIAPEVWSPVYSFIDCLPAFHEEFSKRADLSSVAESVRLEPIINREAETGHKLSNYKERAA